MLFVRPVRSAYEAAFRLAHRATARHVNFQAMPAHRVRQVPAARAVSQVLGGVLLLVYEGA